MSRVSLLWPDETQRTQLFQDTAVHTIRPLYELQVWPWWHGETTCGLWVTVDKTSPHAPGSVQSGRTNLSQAEPSCVLQPDLKLHWVRASGMEKNPKQTGKGETNKKWKFLWLSYRVGKILPFHKGRDLPSAVSVVSVKKSRSHCQNSSVDCLEVLSMSWVQSKPG